MAKPSRQVPTSGKQRAIADLLQKGLALHQSGRAADAAPYYERVLAMDGRQPAANHLLGLVRLSQGRAADAAALIARAVAISPRDAQYLGNLGVALNAAGDPAKAVEALDRAIALKPDFAEAHSNRGMALRTLKRSSDAADAYREAIRLRPNEAGFHLNLANALRDAGYLVDAEAAYRRAASLRPNYVAAFDGLATLLMNQGRAAEALDILASAISALPNDAKLRLRQGRALYLSGQLPEAAEAYRMAIRLDGGLGEAHLQLSYMVRHGDRDAEIADMAGLFGDTKAPAEQRIFAGFGLGKALADIGAHDESIAAFQQANAINRSRISYSSEAAVRELEEDVARFEGLSVASDTGLAGVAPIFVIGLPRSGKSTVEAMLSRHPDVCGVGERPTMARLVRELRQEFRAVQLSDIPRERFAELGRAYMQEVEALASPGQRIVDTMPFNFRHVGYIRLALPDAAIVCPVRPAAEHIIAIHEKYFTGSGHEWSSDLDELKAYHAAVRKQVGDWNRVFPGFVQEVALDDASENRRQQFAALLDFCRLEWSDACATPVESEPQLGARDVGEARANRAAHLAAWRALRPDLWV